MRTPEEYTKNLKDHIITSQMLNDCLYSTNKRAKNWRDQERKYREYNHDKYHNEEKVRDKKEAYYAQKECLLSVIKPICIHREEFTHMERVRVYDYEDEYEELKEQGEFFHENGYYDNELHEYVSFGDIYVEDDPTYRYYLFYDIGGDHTFHTPISEDELSKYADLEIVDIGSLQTYGAAIDDLISVQFVNKVVALVKSNDYKYIA